MNRGKKRLDAQKRGIEFSLTSDQYDYMFAMNNGYCDYTGVRMDTNSGKPRSKSIERIDPNEGYHSWNCLIVCDLANRMKDVLVDSIRIPREPQLARWRNEDPKLFEILMEKMTPEFVKSLMGKYDNNFKAKEQLMPIKYPDLPLKSTEAKSSIISKEVAPEVHKEMTKEVSSKQVTSNSRAVPRDVIISRLYEDMFTKTGDRDFGISLPDFRSKFSVKVDKLTGQMLKDEDKIWFLTNTAGEVVNKDSLIFINKNYKESLVYLVQSSGVPLESFIKSMRAIK